VASGFDHSRKKQKAHVKRIVFYDPDNDGMFDSRSVMDFIDCRSSSRRARNDDCSPKQSTYSRTGP